MKKTNLLISGFAVLALSLIPHPTFAGLGDAEGGTKREFDAYCGKAGNNCKILFTEDKLVVNGKDSITKSQIRSWSTYEDFMYNQYGTVLKGEGTTLIIYDEGGKEGSGTIIFVNANTYKQFVFAMKAFCGAGCRPQGPSIKIEQ